MPKRKTFSLRKDYVAWSHKIYDQNRQDDPLIAEAESLLEEYSYLSQLFYTVCICTFCGAEYWCRDVGAICPNCGVNVSEADMLNWTIFSTHTDEEYTQHIWDEYERRGDLPLMPKGSPVELLQMQLRGFRKALYEHTAQDHKNFVHIQRASLHKIKWLRWKIRVLRWEGPELLNEKIYTCDKCGWQGYLGEAQQHITGVDARWFCPECQKTVLEDEDYGEELKDV